MALAPQARQVYSGCMARGWESKSAEELAAQQEEQRAETGKGAAQKQMTAADAENARAKQLLELKRERILSEKTSHPVRRAALQAALAEIEAEIGKLNG